MINKNMIYQLIRRKKLLVLSIAAMFSLSACETMGPIGVIATKFAQNLLFTSAQNHTPEYANEVQSLMTALVFERNRNDQLSGVGYQQQPQQQMGNAFGDHSMNSNNNPNAFVEDPNLQQQQEIPQQQPVYEQPQYQAMVPQGGNTLAPIALDASILVQRAGQTNSAPGVLNDGETLYDGKGNPKAGDKIKFSFRTNCDCYVYIVGIDATGFAAPIFPDPKSGLTNPVSNNNSRLVPEGTYWYGLDDYRGVEQIYFIASYTPRPDLDDILARLANHKRGPMKNYQPITQAAIVPQTRGLVKIQTGTPVAVQTENGRRHKVTPTAFLSAAGSSDLVVTRWFNHE